MSLKSCGLCCSRPKDIAWSSICKIFLKIYLCLSYIQEACLCLGGNRKDDQICSRCVGFSLTLFEAIPQTDLPAGWLAHKSKLTHLHVRRAQLWAPPSGLYLLYIRLGWFQMSCGNDIAIASSRNSLLGWGEPTLWSLYVMGGMEKYAEPNKPCFPLWPGVREEMWASSEDRAPFMLLLYCIKGKKTWSLLEGVPLPIVLCLSRIQRAERVRWYPISSSAPSDVFSLGMLLIWPGFEGNFFLWGPMEA